MSRSDLPDNVDLWPADPWTLLGIEHDADARSVRLAYTNLIRQFKPDHYPKQFQVIRRAYEQLKSSTSHGQLDSFSISMAPDVTPDMSPDNYATNSASTDADPITHDNLRQHYIDLVEQTRQNPNEEDGYLRSYWTLKTFPVLAPGCDPTEWLERGLQQCSRVDALLDLYSIVLSSRDIDLGTRSFELFPGSLDSWNLIRLAQLRWGSLRAGDEWSVMDNDLKILRTRLLPYDPTSWCSLLSIAIRCLGCSIAPSAISMIDDLWSELSEYAEMQIEMSHEFEAAEVALELARCLRTLNPADNVAELMRVFYLYSWPWEIREGQSTLESILVSWLEHPQLAVDQLDQMAAVCPSILHYVSSALQVFCMPYPSESAEAVRTDVAVTFLYRTSSLAYPQTRVETLEFCLTYLIDPDELASIAAVHNYATSVADKIYEDSVLKCAYDGCMAIQSLEQDDLWG